MDPITAAFASTLASGFANKLMGKDKQPFQFSPPQFAPSSGGLDAYGAHLSSGGLPPVSADLLGNPLIQAFLSRR